MMPAAIANVAEADATRKKRHAPIDTSAYVRTPALLPAITERSSPKSAPRAVARRSCPYISPETLWARSASISERLKSCYDRVIVCIPNRKIICEREDAVAVIAMYYGMV